MYPEAKSVGNRLRQRRPVPLAYVVGFAALMFTLGWQPHERHKDRPQVPVTVGVPAAPQRAQ